MAEEERTNYMISIKRRGVENESILENTFVGCETALLDYIETVRTLGNVFDFKDKIYLEVEVFFEEMEDEE